jgi:uncharacterized Zn finger protein
MGTVQGGVRIKIIIGTNKGKKVDTTFGEDIEHMWGRQETVAGEYEAVSMWRS